MECTHFSYCIVSGTLSFWLKRCRRNTALRTHLFYPVLSTRAADPIPPFSTWYSTVAHHEQWQHFSHYLSWWRQGRFISNTCVVKGVRIRTEAVWIFRLLFYGDVGYAIVDELPAVFVFLVGRQLRGSRTEGSWMYRTCLVYSRFKDNIHIRIGQSFRISAAWGRVNTEWI